jgi:hypothetical protein
MAELSVGPFAEELAGALVNAIERRSAFEKILSDGRGAIVIDPMIRYGGRIILALGDAGELVRGQLEQ